MALLTASEANGLPAICSYVIMASACVTLAITLAVGGFMVASPMGLAVSVLFGGWGW